MSRPETLSALLRLAVRRHHGRTFLAGGGGRAWTYAEVEGAVSALAAELRARQLERGCRIALIGENGPEWVVGLFAAIEIGATVLPLDPAMDADLREAYLESLGAKAVLVGRSSPRFDGEIPTIDLMSVEPIANRRIPNKDPRAPNDKALISITSGAGAEAKVVVLRDGPLLARSRALEKAVLPNIPTGFVFLALLPFYDFFGSSTSLLVAMLRGARVVWPRGHTIDALTTEIARERPTHVFGTPSFLADLRRAVGSKKVARLETLISSGAPLLDEDVNFWRKKGCVVLNAYGLTESCGIVACTRPDDAAPAGVGSPLDGVEIAIEKPNDDGVGQIVIRSREDLQTGDLGRLDAEGRLHLHGRADYAVMRKSGEIVDPEYVEAHLSRAKYVREVAVIKEETAGDERPVALVVPDRDALAREGILDGIGITNFGLRGRAADLSPAARPVRSMIVRGPLPRTRNGKMRRHLLADLVEASREGTKTSHPVAGHALGDSSAARCVEEVLLARDSDRRNLSLEDELALDLGYDSLDRLAVVAALESRLGRRLPERAVLARTVADLIDAVEGDEPKCDETGLAPDAAARELLERARRTARRGGFIRHLVMSRSRRIFEKNLSLHIEGLENLSSDETMIFCPNHLSDLDGLFLSAMLPNELMRRTWVLGKAQVFRNPIARRFLFIGHVLPADNRARFSPALRVARLLLEGGEHLLIFPEGQRALDRRLGIWRGGAGLLAAMTGTPLVPIAIAGVEFVLPPGSIRPRCLDASGSPKPVHLRVAPPIRPGAPAPSQDIRETIERARDLTQKLRAAVRRELHAIPESLRVRG